MFVPFDPNELHRATGYRVYLYTPDYQYVLIQGNHDKRDERTDHIEDS